MTDQERLEQAKTAYHQLVIGAAFVEVRDANGEMVRFKPADATKLKAYILDLERSLGTTSGPRPMRVLG